MKPTLLIMLCAVLAASLLLGGCGQKSALYLPGHNPHPPKSLISPAHPQSAPHAPAADKAKNAASDSSN